MPNPSTIAAEESCCEMWAMALTGGTDSEGYGSLISPVYVDGPAGMQVKSGAWDMGYSLGPIKFCPWCGKKVD